jgi:hypothetical protein
MCKFCTSIISSINGFSDFCSPVIWSSMIHPNSAWNQPLNQMNLFTWCLLITLVRVPVSPVKYKAIACSVTFCAAITGVLLRRRWIALRSRTLPSSTALFKSL